MLMACLLVVIKLTQIFACHLKLKFATTAFDVRFCCRFGCCFIASKWGKKISPVRRPMGALLLSPVPADTHTRRRQHATSGADIAGPHQIRDARRLAAQSANKTCRIGPKSRRRLSQSRKNNNNNRAANATRKQRNRWDALTADELSDTMI